MFVPPRTSGESSRTASPPSPPLAPSSRVSPSSVLQPGDDPCRTRSCSPDLLRAAEDVGRRNSAEPCGAVHNYQTADMSSAEAVAAAAATAQLAEPVCRTPSSSDVKRDIIHLSEVDELELEELEADRREEVRAALEMFSKQDTFSREELATALGEDVLQELLAKRSSKVVEEQSRAVVDKSIIVPRTRSPSPSRRSPQLQAPAVLKLDPNHLGGITLVRVAAAPKIDGLQGDAILLMHKVFPEVVAEVRFLKTGEIAHIDPQRMSILTNPELFFIQVLITGVFHLPHL